MVNALPCRGPLDRAEANPQAADTTSASRQIQVQPAATGSERNRARERSGFMA